MAPVRRIAQIVHLKPSAVAAYKECHANVWPEVLQQIEDCNIKDCTFPLTNLHLKVSDRYSLSDSIFFDNERTLFATFKYVGTDFEGDMEKMRANPKVREWWALTDGMQVSTFNLFHVGICDSKLKVNASQESPISGAVSSAEGPGWWKVLDEVFYNE